MPLIRVDYKPEAMASLLPGYATSLQESVAEMFDWPRRAVDVITMEYGLGSRVNAGASVVGQIGAEFADRNYRLCKAARGLEYGEEHGVSGLTLMLRALTVPTRTLKLERGYAGVINLMAQRADWKFEEV